YPHEPLEVAEWDPATVEVAARVATLVAERLPGVVVEHVGSSAVPGLPGKNIVDLGVDAVPDEIGDIRRVLRDLGFVEDAGPRAFPPTRPLFLGAIEHEGRTHRIHLHVHPRGNRAWGREHAQKLAFRDALRTDPELRDDYARRKLEIVGAGVDDAVRYSTAKTEWIRGTLERLGVADPPIEPPGTIAILGGGQLGRMLALAGRPLGYRFAVLDPDPACPARAVSDRFVEAGYDDVDGALRVADGADVVTYELEHLAVDLAARLDWEWPVRPWAFTLAVTQDRLEERRAVEREGIAVAPWRAVADEAELWTAVEELGLPVRLKATRGGYDGRSQVRVASPDDAIGALSRLGRPAGEAALVERELAFEAELSIVCARDPAGRSRTFPVARNRHDAGILVESVVPAGVPAEVEAEARRIVVTLAEALDVVGTLTAELFLMPDGSLLVNELAPRVHNSGHWSIEATETSQFEQHVRAICGLPLGSTALRAPAATVNLLGTGAEREARATGVSAAIAVPGVHLHLYDKRRVFERRKMGHVTALGETADEALERARA
ncbi:MAG TPA: 5-(carboxyamino)imidazole ribonucleotide synthase, partial [Candidatus Limnocylindrales bacterium]|nr:5-(carboxyamino)imidazole ribonucleotide synthase [Candidatus Limnocylindrales bacterium]